MGQAKAEWPATLYGRRGEVGPIPDPGVAIMLAPSFPSWPSTQTTPPPLLTRVLENDEGGVAAEFHGYLLHSVCRARHQQLAHAGRARECQLAHLRVGCCGREPGGVIDEEARFQEHRSALQPWAQAIDLLPLPAPFSFPPLFPLQPLAPALITSLAWSLLTSSSPMALASPTTMFSTPRGMPARSPSSASANAVSGVSSLGFNTTWDAAGFQRSVGCVLALADEWELGLAGGPTPC